MPRWPRAPKSGTWSARRTSAPKNANPVPDRHDHEDEHRMTKLMQGKRGLIMGLANDKSLAWGIARNLVEHGAEIAISYQGEVMEKRVRPLADQLGCDFLIDCDVSTEAELDKAFAVLAARWPTIDFVVHAIGYTNKEAL